MNRVLLIVTALLLAPLAPVGAAEGETAQPDAIGDPQPGGTVPRELIGDSHFERGCILWEPKTGRHVEYGMITNAAKSGRPLWGLAQWSSREKLPPDPPQTLPSGALRYANAAKAVTFGRPGTADADITLAVNKSHQARDAGKEDATGMFIYLVDGREFTTQSLHDREWVTIDRDLLPLMCEGLKAAWKAGFLKDSQALADYRITGMNLGWEVPGIFDVEMQFRDLSLNVTTSGTENNDMARVIRKDDVRMQNRPMERA